MSKKQFKLILNNLDDRIDKLVSKHGMTPRIEKINEEWVDLMYAFHTQYRGVSDDEELVRLATEIYREINYTQQYEERPLDARLSELKVGISTTGANAIRYGESIVIEDSVEELTKINKRYNEIHGINGEFVNFREIRGPKGLMYSQRHGHNLFQLKMADKDLSNKALGITDTKKRSREDDDKPPIAIKKIKKTFPYYLLQNSIIFVVGDDKTFITTWLNDRKIPYVQEKNGTILVKSDKYEFVYELLGTPSSAYKEPTVLSNLKRSLEEDNKPPVVIKTKFPYYRLDNRYLFIVGDDKMVISKLLIDKKIPFIVENNGDISVKSRSYSSFFELLGTPSSAYKEPAVLSNLKRSRLDIDVREPFITFNGGFVADWYHFRGLSYFQVPWMDYIHNAKITNNHVFILNGVPSIYHVAVKRSSKWSSHIIDSKINIGTNISITPKFGEFIDNKDFLKYDVVFTFLVHEFSATSRHGNAIIIDNVNKLFIRFEPHGAYSECYDVKQCDINFKEMIKNYVPLSRYSYIGPTYQNEKGPQTIEENQTLYNTVVEKIGSTERTLEAGGFCMAWAILCCQYYNDNSRHGYRYDEVYKHLNLSTNELATLIRHFQGWLVNLAKESFGEHYVLIKENLGIK